MQKLVIEVAAGRALRAHFPLSALSAKYVPRQLILILIAQPV
jgi:hypothetical protein